MQSAAGQDVGCEGVDQRLQRRRSRPDPAAQEPALAKAGVEVSRLTRSRAKISAWR
jgi:hypothetical protein